MPAVSQNSGFVGGDENTDTNTSFGTGFGVTLTAASNTEFVMVITFATAVTSLTASFGSQSMTMLNPGGTAITSTNCGFSYAFHLTGPATTTQNLTASWTTTALYREVHMAFDNVAGGVALYSNSGSSATASVVVTTHATTDAAFAMFQNVSANGFLTSGQGAGETQMFAVTDGGVLNDCANFIVGTGATSQTMSNTLAAIDNWVAFGVDLRNIAASTNSCKKLLLGVGCGIWAAKKIEENPQLTRRSLLVPRRRIW